MSLFNNNSYNNNYY